MDLELYSSLARPNDTKVVYLVIDGLGDLPAPLEGEGDGRIVAGETPLEAAHTPNLDALAAQAICGLHEPVLPGITPGSGPAHLAIFGYDPLRYDVGRGVLEALGIGFDLTDRDVAARGNFCTIDASGKITDRRAGRIDTATGAALCERLAAISLPDVELFVRPVKEHRFLFVLRGDGLSDQIADTDPQAVGQAPLNPEPLAEDAERSAQRVRHFAAEARRILAEDSPANMVLLRGFARRPDWPSLATLFQWRCAAIAGYPMYRGVARLIGMDALETGVTLSEELDTLERCWSDYDFIYVHYKATDSAGEDGDAEAKRRHIEEVDAALPRLMECDPDVVVVTGDHSSPAPLRAHSWHPVPAMIWSRHCRPDLVSQFSERACLQGALGPRFPATQLMPLALANALRLDKFGA